MIRSRSTALRIPRGRRKALHRRAVFASEAAPPRRDTMRDQSLINRESEFMTPLNRLRFQRSSGYFSAYGIGSGAGFRRGMLEPLVAMQRVALVRLDQRGIHVQRRHSRRLMLLVHLATLDKAQQ